MSDSEHPNYKELFEQEKRRRQEEQTLRRHEEALRKQEEALRKQEEALRKQEEALRKEAEDSGRRERERNQKTTFEEFLRHCHNLLSLPLKAETPSRSTTGSIPLPTGKYCPTRLELWEDCQTLHQEVYSSVCRYLQPENEESPRLFPSLIEIEGLANRFVSRPISSEQELELYQRIAVEDHVRDIITELCKIPAAREEFGLGDGIFFDNHTNSLNKVDTSREAVSQTSSIHHPRPDRFFMHQVDSETTVPLTSGESKPPHKLSMATIRLGLRPMNLWEHMVRSRKMPTDPTERQKYNAQRLVCSAIVQQYHVMIQKGQALGYLTNGFCDVYLWISHDDPATLYYRLCDPIREIGAGDLNILEPKTAIARRLCLCLMSYRHSMRSQDWRNAARKCLPLWQTNFEQIRSEMPEDDLAHESLHSDGAEPHHVSPGVSSEYQPSSPSTESPTAGRRVHTRSQGACTPSVTRHRTNSPDSSGSDQNPATSGRKRSFSQVKSSPSTQPVPRQRSDQRNPSSYDRHHRAGFCKSSPGLQRAFRPRNATDGRSSQSRRHDARFCTLRCLRGLQDGGLLDDRCPNVKHHRRDLDDSKHPIDADRLVRLLKEQLDEDLDSNCTPFGQFGQAGAPFKVTCNVYGYTVVGKGVTSGWWAEVAREAQFYRILRKAQASATPVFLGTVDLAEVYFIHDKEEIREIRHMLIMGWGGEHPTPTEMDLDVIRQQISRSRREIERLGVIHQDLRRENILWNAELDRILIIDFHRSKLASQPPLQRLRGMKRSRITASRGPETKRLRVL